MSLEGILGNRIFSSYLFVGEDVSGEILAAKNFAKAVNCLSEKEKPCNVCKSCKKIDSETHPDVFFVDIKGASSSIGIDQIRDIIARANLKAYEGKKKVFIINNAHSMNQEASNAFLKTLEEPPKNTIFILISRSKELLLPTIVSRCHIMRFSPAKAVKMQGEGLKIKSKEEIRTYSTKEELKENLESLVSFLRDIFLYKVMNDEKMLFHVDKIEEIKRSSKEFTQEELDCFIRRVITLRSYIDYNVNPKIIIDVLTCELGKFYA